MAMLYEPRWRAQMHLMRRQGPLFRSISLESRAVRIRYESPRAPKIDYSRNFVGSAPQEIGSHRSKAIEIVGGNEGGNGADRDFLVPRRILEQSKPFSFIPLVPFPLTAIPSKLESGSGLGP